MVSQAWRRCWGTVPFCADTVARGLQVSHFGEERLPSGLLPWLVGQSVVFHRRKSVSEKLTVLLLLFYWCSLCKGNHDKKR